MTKPQSAHFLTIALALGLMAMFSPILIAQPNLTPTQLASLTPLDPSADLEVGTFWLVKGRDAAGGVPWPFLPPELRGLNLPMYLVPGTGAVIVDDSTVDYAALDQQRQLDQATRNSSLQSTLSVPDPGDGTGDSGGGSGEGGPLLLNPRIPTDADLWLTIPGVWKADDGSSTVYLAVHPPLTELSNSFDLYLTTNLTQLPMPALSLTNWVWVYRTGPGETNLAIAGNIADQAYFMAAKTNDLDGDFLPDAYEALVSHTDQTTPDAPSILSQPLSQTVWAGDTATLSVTAQGGWLTYQWMFNGAPLSAETNASLTFPAVTLPQAGDYTVQVTSPAGLSVLSSNATLSVQLPWNDTYTPLTGPRQDLCFKSGRSYVILAPVQLYGRTVIEPGTTIKFDTTQNATLQVMGTLLSKSKPYYPATLTSIDDDSAGAFVDWSNSSPVASTNGFPYLDLVFAQDEHPVLNNLRFAYADQAITTPLVASALDVWDCQFVHCNAAIVSAASNAPSVHRLHNVLLAGCQTALQVSGTNASLAGEHVSADAADLWTGPVPPAAITLTNSIIVGNIASGPALITDHCAINPGPVFQTNGAGNYYLQSASSYRNAGTPAISPRLLTEFRAKTTQPPVALPAFMNVTGELTLGRQAPRYTNGPPDYGYHYDAVDYTVAWLTSQGAITILPGTAIGFRNEYSTAYSRSTLWGFDLREGSTFTSHGTPTSPNTFADVQFVQEQPQYPCWASFLPDFWPNETEAPAPTLDCRFSDFFAAQNGAHLWAGHDELSWLLQSPDSLINWSLRDCNLHGGNLILGPPDDGYTYGVPANWVYGSGSVSWANNLFDHVSITLDPTYYWNNSVINCDLSFEAYNNLFRGGSSIILGPFPASAGTWRLRDNLFDKTDFWQDTTQPMDHDYNGYWPMLPTELALGWTGETNRLLPTELGTGATNALHDALLPSAPPYQTGPLGDCYLPNTTLLYHAGSRTPAEAGLFHYTTRLDQFKEGDEPSGHNVNIGLHYVAAANGQPKDSDGDGIPDYVENWHGDGTYTLHTNTETDWQNAMTDGTTQDSHNTAYDTVDLDGDGLTGAAERLMGTSPLVQDNPLQLPGCDTSTTPLDMPVGLNCLTNELTALRLYVDGQETSLSDVVQAQDGTWHIQLDTAGLPNGPHLLQAALSLSPDQENWQTVFGPTSVLLVSNILTMDPLTTVFTDTLHIEAGLNVPADTYTINVYDSDGHPLKTLTGAPQNNWISDSWDLTDTNGNKVVSGPLQCEFILAAATTSRASVNFRLLHHITGKAFTVAYAGYRFPNSQHIVSANVVDDLCMTDGASPEDYDLLPWFANTPYSDNAFEWWIGTNSSSTAGLTSALTDSSSANFYWMGHGGPKTIGPTTNSGITSDTIAKLLGNRGYLGTNTFFNAHPYRLVILDGCSTWSWDWAKTWGVPFFSEGTKDSYTTRGLDPCAYVGWIKTTSQDPSNAGGSAYGRCLNALFENWYRGYRLKTCLGYYNKALLDPLNKPYLQGFDSWKIAGCVDLTTFDR